MIRQLLAAAFAALLIVPAQAATRGGTLVFGRAMESQYLDPVNTSQNADIWLSLNLYDPLLMVSADGKKFLVVSQQEQQGRSFDAIVNWPELLKGK